MPKNISAMRNRSAKLDFDTLEFEDKGDSAAVVAVRLMRLFEFMIDKKDLEKIGKFHVQKNSISFEGVTEEDADRKFNSLIAKNMPHLRNRLTGRKTVYVHQNSGIPLIGTLYFGIVDKGSDMIEIKPITGCNIDCVFCSVGEGLHSKKEADYVVEDDYIIAELKKLLDFKRHDGMKIFINPHGEPLLYSNIIPLVEKISAFGYVDTISIITNGTMLTEKLIDELEGAGLTQMNLSLNSPDPEKSKALSGLNSYDISRIKGMAEYACKNKKLKVVIAPVWIKGLNDDDIEELIKFAKSIGAGIGIQKFIAHKGGKKPSKEIEWDEFYGKIDEFEKKYGLKLRYCEKIEKTKELPMPFRKDETVKAAVVCEGRRKNERIAAAEQRSILVYGCMKNNGSEIRVKMKAAKHNIFTAEEI
ncbi:hypothetical protein COV19_06145 [Candidatus Woesearchaeota archaeon CG10_big_fil_rev_8_21_14_0_10_44_13]|nr:MAG: hypothetical protein COV19_06145 [Candidatus Woesearchaeota archaeon CG10_big_fil_rev_8_21_14_0_10_44_13]